MEYYTFNKYGWYTGETEDKPDKFATTLEPVNKYTGETEGELRSNFTGLEWVEVAYKAPVLPDPLPSAKEAKEAEIIAVANDRINTAIVYNGLVMLVNDVTMSRLNTAINYLAKDTDRSLRYATGFDGVILTITIVEAEQMHDITSIYRADVANNEADLLERTYNATSLEELDAIDITTGWPSQVIS